MERSLFFVVLICVSVNLGHAHLSRHRVPWQSNNLPEEFREICGPDTSEELAEDVFAAYTRAFKYALAQRNDAGGWDEEPFVNTGRAIMNLQLSTDAEWYSEESRDERRRSSLFGGLFGQQAFTLKRALEEVTTKLSVKELEVELLDFLLGMARGEDRLLSALEEMSQSDLASYLMALSLTCHDINDFFGRSPYRAMENRLQRFGDGITDGVPFDGPATSGSCDSIIAGGSPNRAHFYGFSLLLACQNAEEEINPDYFRCTIEAQNNGLFLEPLIIPGLGRYPFGWGDVQLLGMSCLRDRVPDQYKAEWNAIMRLISSWMASMQEEDGSFGGNPIATTLAIQTLKSADASFDRWDCEGAVRNVLSLQDEEGEIAGSLGITLLALPSLSGASMADVGKIRPECDHADTPSE